MTLLRQGYGGQAVRPDWRAGCCRAPRPDRRREELLGDLEELFQAKVTARGRVAARRWYWRQTADAIVDAIRERRRQPKKPAGDSLMQTLTQDLRYACPIARSPIPALPASPC